MICSTLFFLSGALRGADVMITAVRHGLRLVVKDDAARNDFLGLVNTPGMMPSATCVRKHRFTPTMAYCVLMSDQVRTILAADVGGYIVYRTVDSSAQGGHDWVMHGMRAPPVDKIVHIFRRSHELIRHANDDGFNPNPIIEELF